LAAHLVIRHHGYVSQGVLNQLRLSTSKKSEAYKVWFL
jgi:hypothetical protein